jgi:hypothetical protein
MEALKASLGKVRLVDLDRERLIDFGKRAKGGAGPVPSALCSGAGARRQKSMTYISMTSGTL